MEDYFNGVPWSNSNIFYDIENIVIENGVTNIGAFAFEFHRSLSSVTIPNSILSIDDFAFYNCNRLNTVIYCGTANDWKKISIGYANDKLTSTTRIYHLYDNDSDIDCNVCGYVRETETHMPYASVEDVKCAIVSKTYAKGTLGIQCNIADAVQNIDGAVVEYSTVFFTKKMLGDDELVVGYKNASGQSAATVTKKVNHGEIIPDSFVAILKDKASNTSGTVSSAYYNTTFVARPYVKYYDSKSGTYNYIYGNKVEMKCANLFPGLI